MKRILTALRKTNSTTPRIFILILALTLLPAAQLSNANQNNRRKAPAKARVPAKTGRTATSPATGPQHPVDTGHGSPVVAPHTYTVTVDSHGTFNPSAITIRPGDTVEWHGLDRRDAIVQIAGPTAAAPDANACGFADHTRDHAYDNADANEFTGPMRLGVSGIFALGPDGPGYEKVPAGTLCSCENRKTPNCMPDPTVVGDEKICPDQGPPYETLDLTMTNPDITGIIIRQNWSDIQKDTGGQIEFVWTDLDRQMDRAVKNGKLFTLDVRAGMVGTPPWIFTTYGGPGLALPGPVMPLLFKDWAGGDSPPSDNCGFRMTLGSPTHTTYINLYLAMMKALAKHVASDSRWFQALAHVKVSGANFISSEAHMPKRCFDGATIQKSDGSRFPPIGPDGKLDIVQGDPCFCNTQRWADASYTPEGLYRYYRLVEHEIYESFFGKKSMGYQLIQDGFPIVESATNFEGDTLSDQDGSPLLRPKGTKDDDIGAFDQTVKVLEEGRSGLFVDPLGTPRSSPTAGYLFVAQHSGIQQLPEDTIGGARCKQRQAVDPITHRAKFPIGSDVTIDFEYNGCPNGWAVNEGVRYGRLMGFQTTNNHSGKGPVGSPANVESALWNLTINSNAVFLELYEERLWEIARIMRTGSGADVLSPDRVNPKWIGPRNDSAPYTKNLHAWVEELHDRRKQLAANPNMPDPFPTIYKFTFSKPITAQQTYYYVNPAKCTPSLGASGVGRVTVRP